MIINVYNHYLFSYKFFDKFKNIIFAECIGVPYSHLNININEKTKVCLIVFIL